MHAPVAHVQAPEHSFTIFPDRTIPEVAVISFHTPQFPVRTKAGTVKPP